MLVLSLRSQIEETSAGGSKGFGGAIRSFELFTQDGALAGLEKAHPGTFSYLAFHPIADEPVTAYLREGTLPGDSGPHNMVLFSLDVQATWPIPVDERAFVSPYIDVDTMTHPAYMAVRELFKPKPPPPLPGIAFFRNFSGEHDVIYGDLSGAKSSAEVRLKLRSLLAASEAAFKRSESRRGRNFADELAVALESERLAFTRTGSVAVRQWLIRVYRYVEEHAGDIVSAVGLVT